MIYGAHVFLWIERWSDSTIDLLDRARSLGLSCLEIALGDDVIFTPALVRRRAEMFGMQIVGSPGGDWPMNADISDDDPANRKFGLDWHRRQIDICAEMGAVAYTGAIYGHPGRVCRRIPPKDEYPRTAENLHILAEYAASRGMPLVLEPMSHFRTHMVNTPAQAMRLIELAGHANLRVLLDTYHMVTEVRDYAQAVRECASRLWGIHACENDRGVPGLGLVPWESLFAALRECRFDGYVIMEGYNSSLGDFAERRGMFHNVCPDGDEFVRAGLRFLRRSG
jgi:D-psicose/D-tagatose/L-ribulose 3-epimerase